MQVRNALDLSPHARNLDPYWNAASAKSLEEAKQRKIAREQAEAQGKSQNQSQGQTPGEGQSHRHIGGHSQGHTRTQVQGGASVRQAVGHSSNTNNTTQKNSQNGTNMNRTQRRKPFKEGDEEEKPFGPPKALPIGLSRLIARYFSLNLVKPKSVSMSNWEKVPLTERELTCE
jgi:hypothetical protein